MADVKYTGHFMTNYLSCGTHGKQPETAVCKHIVKAMKTGKEVGFYWSVENQEYDAVCEKCNKLSDEQWLSQQNDLIRLLCLGCFKVAAGHHGIEIGEVA